MSDMSIEEKEKFLMETLGYSRDPALGLYLGPEYKIVEALSTREEVEEVDLDYRPDRETGYKWRAIIYSKDEGEVFGITMGSRRFANRPYDALVEAAYHYLTDDAVLTTHNVDHYPLDDLRGRVNKYLGIVPEMYFLDTSETEELMMEKGYNGYCCFRNGGYYYVFSTKEPKGADPFKVYETKGEAFYRGAAKAILDHDGEL